MSSNKTTTTVEDLSKKKAGEKRAAHRKEINARLDADYDGYYNDIEPAESNSGQQEINKEMIKRVALIAVGATVIIVLAILGMLFL